MIFLHQKNERSASKSWQFTNDVGDHEGVVARFIAPWGGEGIPHVPLNLFSVCLSLRLYPDTPFVHQVDLLLNDLLPVLSMLHRLAIQVQILRINRLFVNNLI
jgi:hypothetical protein